MTNFELYIEKKPQLSSHSWGGGSPPHPPLNSPLLLSSSGEPASARQSTAPCRPPSKVQPEPQSYPVTIFLGGPGKFAPPPNGFGLDIFVLGFSLPFVIFFFLVENLFLGVGGAGVMV